MTTYLIVILVVFATLFFSLNPELNSVITKHSLFRIGILVIFMYFAYNNLTDGFILLCFIVLLALVTKPELQNIIKDNIEKNRMKLFPNSNNIYNESNRLPVCFSNRVITT